MSALSEVLHRTNKATFMHSDLVVVYEVALHALCDSEMFCVVADRLNVSEKELRRVERDLSSALKEQS